MPQHLKKFIVSQNYKSYTAQDQAIWRYIVKGIEKNLDVYGYKNGSLGLKKLGIFSHKIPKISDISKRLEDFDWTAVTVSGFLPPQAFMEFQNHHILPVASELRTLNHIYYTPAPDIIHEAVGHAPYLFYKSYRKFLKKYAEVVLKAISSGEDRSIYMAIRDLSDLKEHPNSKIKQIQKAEDHLNQLIKKKSYVSESSYLSRFIWWTSEYGLIGTTKNYKMYGAGLISSIQEAKQMHKVKKIKLDENCIKYDYDITRFQPQLFVAESFDHLTEVLDKIASRLAWKLGGVTGVNKAIESKVINTIELDSGLQIAGVAEQVRVVGKDISFLKFSGSCQLAFHQKELAGHSKKYHSEGYSSPLQILTKNKKPMHLWTPQDLKKEGLIKGKKVELQFKGGIHLKGEFVKSLRKEGRLLILTFKQTLITHKEELLFHPSWGAFDLAVGSKVSSVFARAADNKAYKNRDEFEVSKIPKKTFSKKQKEEFKFYAEIAKLRSYKKQQLSLKKKLTTKESLKIEKILQDLYVKLLKKKEAWLPALEILELSKKGSEQEKRITSYLKKALQKYSLKVRKIIKEDLDLYRN